MCAQAVRSEQVGNISADQVEVAQSSAGGAQQHGDYNVSPHAALCRRCPTLLHFVARAAATGHPGSASLHAALPSCSAAACLDLPAVQEQLRQLVLEVEGRSMAAGSVAALQVEELQQQLGKAEAAFRCASGCCLAPDV